MQSSHKLSGVVENRWASRPAIHDEAEMSASSGPLTAMTETEQQARWGIVGSDDCARDGATVPSLNNAARSESRGAVAGA